MRGLEYSVLATLLILLAIIILVALIVIRPSLVFGKTTETKVSFEEFCVFWSLNGYREGCGEEVKRGTPEISYGRPEQYCGPIFGEFALDCTAANSVEIIDNCKKCCKKEKIC